MTNDAGTRGTLPALAAYVLVAAAGTACSPGSAEPRPPPRAEAPLASPPAPQLAPSSTPLAPSAIASGGSDATASTDASWDDNPPSAEPPGYPAVRLPTPTWRSSTDEPGQRVREAESRRLGVVRGLFAGAGVAFPPRQMLLRAFKQEERLEVWAASDTTSPLTHVTTYGFCYASGDLGPKRREGDLQVPEGFYVFSYFNAASSYHLSMLVSYPNASDRILSDKLHPGGEIMVHGRCVSIGCISLSDERVEELWVASKPVVDAGGKVRIHIFPARDIPALIASGRHPEQHDFWQNLDEGKQRFEREHRMLRVDVDARGRYVFPP